MEEAPPVTHFWVRTASNNEHDRLFIDFGRVITLLGDVRSEWTKA